MKLKIFLVFCLFFVMLFCSNFTIDASNNENILNEKIENKIICEATINDEFDDSNILIVLGEDFSQFSGISTEVSNLLYENGVESIQNLIEYSSRFLDSNNLLNSLRGKDSIEYYKETPFKQILKVKLKTRGKQHVLDMIKKFEKFDYIISASPDYIDTISYTPNDPSFSSLWGLKNNYGVNAIEAWDISPSSTNVRVGIMDTGIANHSDLRVVKGYDFYNDNSTTSDDVEGHGTHVAGIVGAIGNNGIGICGVAPNVTLVPLQVTHHNEETDREAATTSDRIKAINYAINLWNTDERISILNHSIGGFGENVALLSAIENFPGLFVWSAGNDNKNVDDFGDISKFKLKNLISVGAINSSGKKASFSNYGLNVDIFAPGVDIWSTVLNNGYAYYSGTSMAAPFVSGIAALLLSYNNDFSASSLKRIMCSNVQYLPATSSVKCNSGGTVNAYYSLQYASELQNNTYWFVVDQIHSLESSATYITGFSRGYNDAYTITADEYRTFSSGGTNDKRSFTEWKIILDGSEFHDYQTNPWISISTDRTLTISIKEIVDQYYPINDTTCNIYIRAFYLTPVNSGSCISQGSKITLADGSQKNVEELTGNEELLVWNFYEGKFDSAPILFIDSEISKIYSLVCLQFSDNTIVEVIDEHAFYDINLKKYVYLRSDADKYIGHSFIKYNVIKKENEEVKLISVEIKNQYTSAYSPVTFGHLCYYVNGMLSIPGGIEGLFNIFEIDSEALVYNQELMNQEINKYGLFTYDEFNQIFQVPEQVFEGVSGKYLKIAIGKGLTTLEELEWLVVKYNNLFDYLID